MGFLFVRTDVLIEFVSFLLRPQYSKLTSRDIGRWKCFRKYDARELSVDGNILYVPATTLRGEM